MRLRALWAAGALMLCAVSVDLSPLAPVLGGEGRKLKIEDRRSTTPILNPQSSILNLQSPLDSIRDLVYWGTGGPIRIRLHLQIVGRPADAVWSEAVGALFAFCDRNGDGVLDAAEYAPFVEPRRGRDRQVVPENVSGMPALRLTFGERDAKVTRAMFETALRDAGYGPALLTVTPTQPNSQRLSTALFRRLDRDGDGKLSAEELRAARERLAFFDTNEDELISVAELLGNVEPTVFRPVAPQRATPAAAMESTSDLVLLPGDSEAAIKQIVSSRGDAKSKTIRRAEFGGDDKTFAALDKNGDGRLDAAELEAWLRLAPDLEMSFSVGSLSLLSKQDGGTLRVQTKPTGDIEASRARVSFRFDQPAASQQTDAVRSGQINMVRAEMKRLADAKGVVQRKQAESQPRRPDSFDVLAFFDLADRNLDGKLETAEVEAALKVLAPLLAACRTTITIRDQGNGLFELLDRNGDSRLSPRELVEAALVLKPFTDATGKVGPSDLPRRFFVQVAVEPIPVIYFPAPPPTAKKELPREGVPVWFTDMDRNGDGDVSLREFLGPIELFRKLDKNGDGLISLDEAQAARFDR